MSEQRECDHCNGDGVVPLQLAGWEHAQPRICSRCNGSGVYNRPDRDIYQGMSKETRELIEAAAAVLADTLGQDDENEYTYYEICRESVERLRRALGNVRRATQGSQ